MYLVPCIIVVPEPSLTCKANARSNSRRCCCLYPGSSPELSRAVLGTACAPCWLRWHLQGRSLLLAKLRSLAKPAKREFCTCRIYTPRVAFALLPTAAAASSGQPTYSNQLLTLARCWSLSRWGANDVRPGVLCKVECCEESCTDADSWHGCLLVAVWVGSDQHPMRQSRRAGEAVVLLRRR